MSLPTEHDDIRGYHEEDDRPKEWREPEPMKETQEERYNGFKVTIDDGFVAYEYRFPGGDHLSIHQIAEAISSQTGMEIESHKLINP